MFQNLALKDKEEKGEKEVNQRIEVNSQSMVKYATSFAVQMEILGGTTRRIEPICCLDKIVLYLQNFQFLRYKTFI